MTFETEIRFDENGNYEDIYGSPAIIHGKTCVKVRHGSVNMFIHEPDHDGPYEVGFVKYCGRCHARLG